MMRKFICEKCNALFEQLVRKRRPPEQEKEPIFPIKCPRCHSEEVRII